MDAQRFFLIIVIYALWANTNICGIIVLIMSCLLNDSCWYKIYVLVTFQVKTHWMLQQGQQRYIPIFWINCYFPKIQKLVCYYFFIFAFVCTRFVWNYRNHLVLRITMAYYLLYWGNLENSFYYVVLGNVLSSSQLTIFRSMLQILSSNASCLLICPMIYAWNIGWMTNFYSKSKHNLSI